MPGFDFSLREPQTCRTNTILNGMKHTSNIHRDIVGALVEILLFSAPRKARFRVSSLRFYFGEKKTSEIGDPERF